MLLLDSEKLDALLETRGFGVVAFAGAARIDRNSVAAILNNRRTVQNDPHVTVLVERFYPPSSYRVLDFFCHFGPFPHRSRIRRSIGSRESRGARPRPLRFNYLSIQPEQPFVSNAASEVEMVTVVGPWGLPLAMMLSSSPEASDNRAQ